ncbi:MAG TPA: hypothetical protein VJY35_15665 [Candidatus Eisenbacteria bacterium]|nr:hypothetical protein [Candidatus Eisenbacteria bacterium]
MPAQTPGEARFVAEGEPSVTLRLNETADGGINGTLSEGAVAMPLTARRGGAGFSGTVGPAGGAMRFTATERGDQVVLQIGTGDESERLTFKRVTGGDRVAAGSPGAGGGRHVVINERRLSDQELARAEQTYRIRIPDADYWYDRVLGAWGAKGQPTMGFIAPGLDLGGPLRPDASGGGTHVFVNGRELPPPDLMALQQITGPVPPGRYFITAQGLAGYEGGPAQWNLAAMAAQSGGGGSNAWQSRITGASGFSDGTTGAVFLPNGGIVSTGN